MDKNIQKITEDKLKNYYKSLKTLSKLQYELGVLKKNLGKLEKLKLRYELEHSSDGLCEVLQELRQKNNNSIERILNIEIKISQISEDNSSLEYIISQMSDEDKQLLELRYKYEEKLDKLIHIVHLSKSTLSRKCNKIVSIVAEELE